jgi:hypothetical protein
MNRASNPQGGDRHRSISYGYEIDPCAILGVSPNASLQEIRDAYRNQARKHHPDHGGDEWAFKIVVRSYEVLSTARVVGRVSQETRRPEPAPRAAPETRHEPRTFDPDGVRPGRKDSGIDPAYVVDVEVFRVGFDLENPIELVLLPAKDRTLSCCLNISWAAPAHPSSLEPAEVTRVLHDLSEVFDTMPAKTQATSSWSRPLGDGFEGWLSYPTASQAWEAFRIFHDALNAHGLGVNQWTREMLIPRNLK